MPHSHSQGRVGTLFRIQPDIGKLGCIAVIGRDCYHLRSLISHLCKERRIGSTCNRHIRSPKHYERRIVPVGTFRNICLLAPGLGRGGRQVAIEIIETEYRTSYEAQIPGTRSIRNHRKGRNRRKANQPVGTKFLNRIDVGRCNDFLGKIPVKS